MADILSKSIYSMNLRELDAYRQYFMAGRNIYQISWDEFCQVLVPIQHRREDLVAR